MSWRQYDPGPEFAFAIGQALLDFIVDHDDALSFLAFHATAHDMTKIFCQICMSHFLA